MYFLSACRSSLTGNVFVTALGRALALALACSVWSAWPGGVGAQPAIKRIAIFYQDSGLSPRLDMFKEMMHAQGHVEGKDVEYVYHLAWPGRDDIDLAAERLVREGADLIFAVGTPPALAARKASTTIPILFYAADPIGTGLAESLAHPGGNATGIASLAEELSSKRLEILTEAAPKVKRIGVLANTGNPATRRQLDAMEPAAKTLGVTLSIFPVSNNVQLGRALASLARKRVDAIFLTADVVLNVHQKRIAGHALKAKLPTISPFAEFARAGGLLFYGPDFRDVLRRCAAYAGRMLKGTAASDLPVEQVSRFRLAVNLRTAKVLGLAMPETIMVRAEEVVK
ncbi:MAG: ABC transporter substrate-binding protein [Burkholderiales bacterium]